MKKILIAALVLVAASLSAEPVAQPAFRLLDGYLEKRTLAAEYGAKAGPWALMGTGVALGAASATVWFAGDAIADGAGAPRMSREVRFGTTLGLGVGAIVLTGIGYMLHLSPPAVDERAQYSAIYQETDPSLQESLAAARLESLAETSKGTRVVSGWVNLAIAGFSLGLQVSDNYHHGRPWTSSLFDRWDWPWGSVLTGATSLLLKSEEEQLYEEYQAVVARLARTPGN
jgi:MFS family permease